MGRKISQKRAKQKETKRDIGEGEVRGEARIQKNASHVAGDAFDANADAAVVVVVVAAVCSGVTEAWYIRRP